MIINKKNSVNSKRFINYSKNSIKDKNESINTKQILIKKGNLNHEGSMPIKVHLIGKSSKNGQKKESKFIDINNNKTHISSFHNKKTIKNNNEPKINTSSSFHKQNKKIVIEPLNNKGLNNKNDNKNNDEQKEEISKLKEMLTAKKENIKYKNLLIKKEIIPFQNIKRFETENNENKNEEIGKKEKNIKEIILSRSNINNNRKRNIFNLEIKSNKNINKEKIYSLIYKKNKNQENININDKEPNKKINNENFIEDNNKDIINDKENFPKTEQKQNSDICKHKIRNILSKNFFNKEKPKFCTLELININNHSRIINKSPEGKSIINTISDYENINKDKKSEEKKENKNENEIKSLKSNNSKDTINKTSSAKTNTITSNLTDKRNDLRNNILNNNNYFILSNTNNKNKKILFSSFQINNKNNNLNLKYSNSPKNYNIYESLNNTKNNQTLKAEDKLSIEMKNKMNKFQILSTQKNEINDDKNGKIDIKFDELVLYEERLNDIYIAINSFENMEGIEGGGISDECLEFFEFYLNSSINNKIAKFFTDDNFIIIQSSINLQLYTIMLTYHLSFFSRILAESIIFLMDIFSKLKNNFYLLIKQILIYYNNINFFELNEKQKDFNIIINLLNNANIYNINKFTQDKIILKINTNCSNISNEIHKILDIYQQYSKNNNINSINYYNELINIFNQLSIIKENDITNYFFNNIYNEENIKIEKNRNKVYNIFLNYKKFNSTKKNINKSSYKQNNTENNFYQNRKINSFIKDININNNIIETEQNENIITTNNNYISVYRIHGNFNNKSHSFINNNNFILNINTPFIKVPRAKNKKYTLILDLDETLVHVKQINMQNNSCYFNSYNNNYNQKIINLRPGLFSFLNTVKPYYEIISFSSASKAYADNILKKIETNQKYFEYNLYREHTVLYKNEFVKDISKIGRNIKETIIVDNLEKNFILNPDNGIKIAPYFGEIGNRNEDNKLFELQKLLILFYKLKYEDLRMAIKDYAQFIFDKISTSN